MSRDSSHESISSSKLESDSGSNYVYIYQSMKEIMKGNLENSLLDTWKTIIPQGKLMIFVSSTFLDTIKERDCLHQNILPQLQEQGSLNNIDVILYDMRFGIKDENTKDHMTWIACQEGINQCYYGSDGIFFLSLQSDRYGYLPLPKYLIEKDVLKRIPEIDPEKDGALIDLFNEAYELDTNHLPPQYELKPLNKKIGGIEDSYYYNEVLPKLRDFLLNDFIFDNHEGANENEMLKINQSVTHWETIYALNGESERCYWIYRSFDKTLLQQLDDPNNRNKLADCLLNPSLMSKLNSLLLLMKEKLREDQIRSFPNRITPIDYLNDSKENTISSNSEYQDYINEWKREVYSLLSLEINKIERKRTNWNDIGNSIVFNSIPYFEEILHHSKFALEKSKQFIGREHLLKKALQLISPMTSYGEQAFSPSKAKTTKRSGFLSRLFDRRRGKKGSDVTVSSDENMLDPSLKPFALANLALIGRSGCGKTSLIAKLAEILSQSSSADELDLDLDFEFEKYPVIIRFCGTSANSFSGIKLIQSISLQILWAYGQMEVVRSLIADFPNQRYEDAVASFHKILSIFPVYLLIDSLDQLENRNEERTKLSFLQGMKPCIQSRIIVSSLPDELFDLKTDGKPRKLYFFQCEKTLRSFDVPILTVSALQEQTESEEGEGVNNEIERVTRILLEKSGKQLTKSQMEIVLCAISLEPTMLYITLAMNIITQWKSFEIHYNLTATVKGVIHQMFDYLELHYGIKFVSISLSMITFSRQGITDIEMKDLLSLHAEVLHEVFQYSTLHCFPIHVWLRLKQHPFLKTLLIEKSENHCIKWFHRQLQEIAMDRYEDKALECHRIMGIYFTNRVNSIEKNQREIHDCPLVLNHLSIWLPNCKVNHRRTIEGYYHLIKGGLLKEAQEEMCSMAFVCASALCDDIFHYLQQMNILSSLFEGSVEKKSAINDYLLWVRKNGLLIATDPSWNVRTTAAMQPIDSVIRRDILHHFHQSLHPESLQDPSNTMSEQQLQKSSSSNNQWDCCHVLGIAPKKSSVEMEFRGHYQPISCIKWNTTGNLLATGADDNLIMIWDGALGERLQILRGHRSRITGLKWTRDSSQLISCAWDFQIIFWNTESGDIIKSIIYHAAGSGFLLFMHSLNSVDVNLMETKVVAGCHNLIQIWDITTSDLEHVLQGHDDHVVCVNWSYHLDNGSNHNRILSGSSDSIKIWDSETAELLMTLSGCAPCSWSYDNSQIVSSSDDKTIKIWNSQTGDLHRVIVHESRVIVWSPHSNHTIATAERGISLWNTSTGELITSVSEDNDNLYDISWNPCQEEIFASSSVYCNRIWRIQKNQSLLSIPEKPRNTNKTKPIVGYRALWNRSETLVLTSSRPDSCIAVWNGITGELIHCFECHAENASNFSTVWGDNESTILSFGIVKDSDSELGVTTIEVWDSSTGEFLKNVRCNEFVCNDAVAWNSNRSQVAFGVDQEPYFVMVDTTTGQLIHKFDYHTERVSALSWSPNDLMIASGGHEHKVVVWNAVDGSLSRVIEGYTSWISEHSLSWNHQSTRLASADLKGTLIIFDMIDNENTVIWKTEAVDTHCLAWSSDDTQMLSDDGYYIRMWDTKTGLLSCSLKDNQSVWWLRWGQDGKRILSGSPHRIVKIWFM